MADNKQNISSQYNAVATKANVILGMNKQQGTSTRSKEVISILPLAVDCYWNTVSSLVLTIHKRCW